MSEGQSRMTKVKTKSRGRRVWHITDFRKLFELSDDLRKKRPGPLTYTKSPVTLTAGSKDHDIKLWEKLQQLKSRPERHLLRSVFEDLKCWAGLKTIKDRGFLITTEGLPATYEYIAAQLKLEVDEIKRAMALLEEVGLLERQTIKNKQPKTDTSGPSRKKADKSGQGRTKTDAAGRARKKPDKAGRKRKPFKKVNDNGKDNSKVDKKRQDSEDKPNAIEVPPSTTQPLKPHTSAKGGALIPFTSPSKLKNTQLLGDIAEGMLHRYNPDAKLFSLEIYQALKLPWDPTSEKGKRELGCFASMWQKAWRNKASMEAIDELRERAIAEARKIACRRQNKKKGAVWCHVFKNLEPAYQKRKLK